MAWKHFFRGHCTTAEKFPIMLLRMILVTDSLIERGGQDVHSTAVLSLSVPLLGPCLLLSDVSIDASWCRGLASSPIESLSKQTKVSRRILKVAEPSQHVDHWYWLWAPINLGSNKICPINFARINFAPLNWSFLVWCLNYMYLFDAWADECWWNKSAWLHDWGWDALLDQGFWEKLLQGLGGAWGAWVLVHGLDRGCSWEPPPPPLWKCEERREERELVPQPDMPGRIKKLIPCHFQTLYKKKWTAYKTFPDRLALHQNQTPSKVREHSSSQ